MVKAPKISATMEKKYVGKTIISLDGKILGIGSDCLVALKKAKKVMPDIEKKEFLVSRILPKYVAPYLYVHQK
ncbi:MAG: hypothetical protein AAB953_02500 [Patescibacteria group bacterium]